jgi:hypothetical protein
MAETYHSFRFSESNIFRAMTGNPNQHDSTHEIGFQAQAIFVRRAARTKVQLICPVRGDSVRIEDGKSNQCFGTALATDIRCEPISAQRFPDIGQFSSTIVLMPANCPEVSGGACDKPKHDKPIMRLQRLCCIIVKPVGIISASRCLSLVDHRSRPMAVSAALS